MINHPGLKKANEQAVEFQPNNTQQFSAKNTIVSELQKQAETHRTNGIEEQQSAAT